MINNYLTQAIHNAKISELTDFYRAKNYQVIKKPKVENMVFDLLVKKGEKQIIFEVKTAPLTTTTKENILRQQKLAKEQGLDFRLIMVSRPKSPSIDIEWLHDELLNELTAIQEEIDHLATHVDVDDIEFEYQSIHISNSVAEVEVSGVLYLALQYGSNSDVKNDMGETIEDSLDFSATLSLDMSHSKILNVDWNFDQKSDILSQ
jgi:hypothetical protein